MGNYLYTKVMESNIFSSSTYNILNTSYHDAAKPSAGEGIRLLDCVVTVSVCPVIFHDQCENRLLGTSVLRYSSTCNGPGLKIIQT